MKKTFEVYFSRDGNYRDIEWFLAVEKSRSRLDHPGVKVVQVDIFKCPIADFLKEAEVGKRKKLAKVTIEFKDKKWVNKNIRSKFIGLITYLRVNYDKFIRRNG